MMANTPLLYQILIIPVRGPRVSDGRWNAKLILNKVSNFLMSHLSKMTNIAIRVPVRNR